MSGDVLQAHKVSSFCWEGRFMTERKVCGAGAKYIPGAELGAIELVNLQLEHLQQKNNNHILTKAKMGVKTYFNYCRWNTKGLELKQKIMGGRGTDSGALSRL